MKLGPLNLLEVDESLFRPIKRHRRDWGAEVKQWWGLVGRKRLSNTVASRQLQLPFDVAP